MEIHKQTAKGWSTTPTTEARWSAGFLDPPNATRLRGGDGYGWGMGDKSPRFFQDFSRQKSHLCEDLDFQVFPWFQKKNPGDDKPGFLVGINKPRNFCCWCVFFLGDFLCFVASLLVVDSESETCPTFSKARRLGGGALYPTLDSCSCLLSWTPTVEND